MINESSICVKFKDASKMTIHLSLLVMQLNYPKVGKENVKTNGTRAFKAIDSILFQLFNFDIPVADFIAMIL